MKNTFLFGVLIIALYSCEDFFQTTIEVDPPEHTPSLVVHMYINDSGDTIQASVTKSIGSLETIKSREEILINDATVQIKNQQGELLYALHNMDPGEEGVINYHLGLDHFFGGNNQIFRLEIEHPVLGKASAVQTMPQTVVISEPQFTKDAGIDIDGFQYNTVSFHLDDPAGQENYYQMKLMITTEIDGQSYYLYPYSNDPVYSASYDWESLLLSDKTFNGKSFLVKLQFNQYQFEGEDPESSYTEGLKRGMLKEEIPGQLFIDIKGISKDFYLYARSMKAYQESDDFGFTEPVTIHNNIENGLGIFSLSSRKLVQIEN